MLAALAGIGLVVAKKLGLMGRNAEPIEYAPDPVFPEDAAADSAEGGEEHASD